MTSASGDMPTVAPVLLGRRYRDTATGYEGVATARTEFLHGSVSVRLERLKADGTTEETWWPEGRLAEVADTAGPGFGVRP